MNCRTLYIESFFFWKNYIDCQQSIATLLCVCVCAPERTPLAISLSVTSQTGRFLCLWDFPGKNTGVGCHFLLQGSSLPRDRTWVSHIVGGHFAIWATRTGKIHESRLIESGRTGDGKSECWHFGISKLKWTGIDEFNSDEHYIYYCGQESLRRNGVALIVNKRVQNAVLGYNLKNDRMISVHFQGRPFNITVIMLNKLKLDGSVKTYKAF